MIQFYLGYENQVYIKVITPTSSGPEFRLEVLPEEQKIGGQIDTSFAANGIFLRVPREGRAEGERESSISALSSCWAEVKMRRGVAITQRGKGEKGCIGIGNGMVTQTEQVKSYHSQN